MISSKESYIKKYHYVKLNNICKLQCYCSWVIEQNYFWFEDDYKEHFAPAHLGGSNKLRSSLEFLYGPHLLRVNLYKTRKIWLSEVLIQIEASKNWIMQALDQS